MPILRRASPAVALAAIPMIIAAATALATPVNYDCQASVPLLGAKTFALAQDVNVTAPEKVAPGGDLTIVVDPTPGTLPAEVQGYKVDRLEKVALKIPVPGNTTFVSAERSGGSGVGQTDISVAGGVAVMTASGPIRGAYEFPTVTIRLKAGQAGAVETRLYGSSYDDPGLTGTAVVQTGLGGVNVPARCFPHPNPVITSTVIG